MHKLITLQSTFDFIKNQTYHIAFYGDYDEKSGSFDINRFLLSKYVNGFNCPHGLSKYGVTYHTKEIEKVFLDNIDNIINTIINDLTLSEYDLIISPPSEEIFNKLFVSKIKERVVIKNDYSQRFNPKSLKMGKDKNIPDKDLYNELKLDFKIPPDIKNVLIFDEIINTGRTISALIAKLYDAGLNKSATIFLSSIYCFI